MLPIRTARLTLRALTTADAPAVAAYHGDADVARYQDWPLPVDGEAMRRRFADQPPAPEPGRWMQIGVEHHGELVGDLAVGLDTAGHQAGIGYSLRADRQGLGIGREAVSALVDALLDGLGVHRISATLDPDNVRSAHLLEQLGFRYEGRSPSAALVRGAWLDDDRYALLAADREAWRARPTGPPQDVALVPVDASTTRAVWRLVTHRSQERFVATTAVSFADALFPESVDGVPLLPWLRMITADGEPAGFVMLAEVTSTVPDPYLWRLLVDRRHQRRGVGARAVGLLGERLREQGRTRLVTSWVEGPGGPGPFYRRLGFVPTGEIDDGETVAALALG
ncbi:GNAT family N-acetyltransferase [Pseudonocardia abyssalis]|uniref:N-acetyltransferase n=1 Tax=Pseudonocardia abyssalis TaxID=2792008 RepID=A0ABS6UPF3_9PSEU|nr:GNAT family N-acetyltransferase [Pseudonocardia abyssalis]MBW0116808.1 N-acetyltransferase [Pseudonocardia abyssalis]MBW0134100.1 N-acetyltransferase [Pseudonocardia abyssalis]